MFNWLFGGSSGKDSGDGTVQPPKNPTIDLLSSGIDENMKIPTAGSAFDPSVLERIANAAKELSKSEHAKDLIDVAREQEKSWQAKFSAIQAEQVAHQKDSEIQRTRIAGEEQRRTLEEDTRQQQARAQYQDQLARKRYEDQLHQQREAQARELQMKEQSQARLEQERRRTVEYEAQLRQQTELVRVRAEAEANAKNERENKDIRNEQLLLQAEQYRITVLEGIRAAGQTVGQGIRTFLDDPTAIAATAGAIAAMALGIYGARATASVAGQYVSSRLGKPPLIRDTSRKSWLLRPIQAIKGALSSKTGTSLEGIVLNDSVRERLQTITIATARARQYKAQYRHLMLHGPPGTGKTMFARRLAQQSGLEYAMLAGGDVGPLGSAAVTEIHRVFDWAQASRKGVLLFVDEADAFLRKRGDEGDGQMSEPMRNALSTFLYRTGDPTNKFMLVFATNEPSSIDRAVTDRVDEVVELDLPQSAERAQLLDLYIKQFVLSPPAGGRAIDLAPGVDLQSKAALERIAAQLNGFSGRQISKLCRAWQAAAQASPEFTLTQAMVDKEIASHRDQLLLKSRWLATKTKHV